MKAVILCAGSGTRTGLNYPKCLYKFKDGESLLTKNIDNIKKLGFKNTDIILATGFRESLIKKETKNLYTYIKNKNFNSTNMIFSLNEVIKKYKAQTYYVFYADIIFELKAVKYLKNTKKEITTLIDEDWLKKWKLKDDYLDDLEELKISKNIINSLGKKVKKIDGINGRFIGITKFSKKAIQILINEKIFTNELKKNQKIDFTNFLMKLIKRKFNIYALKKKIKWFEFDKINDFKIHKNDFF
jgi:choline kinase